MKDKESSRKDTSPPVKRAYQKPVITKYQKIKKAYLATVNSAT